MKILITTILIFCNACCIAQNNGNRLDSILKVMRDSGVVTGTLGTLGTGGEGVIDPCFSISTAMRITPWTDSVFYPLRDTVAVIIWLIIGFQAGCLFSSVSNQVPVNMLVVACAPSIVIFLSIIQFSIKEK